MVLCPIWKEDVKTSFDNEYQNGWEPNQVKYPLHPYG